jgi:hypothetical protein
MAEVRSQKTMQTRPTYIQVGPGVLWTGVRKPPDDPTSTGVGVLAVSGYQSGPMDMRLYGPALFTVSGVMAGATIGDSTFSYKPTFVDIGIETSSALVEKVLNMESSTCAFSIAELTSENMVLAIPVGTNQISNDPLNFIPGTTTPQIQHTIKVGGLQLTAPQCIAFISPNRRIAQNSGPFSYVYCAYNAVGVDGFDMPFSRGKETVFKLTFEAIADVTRTLGDQLFQFTARSAS